MRNSMLINRSSNPPLGDLSVSFEGSSQIIRKLIIGAILVLAMFAFEMFNFDTTRYALQSLLGDVRFLDLAWATILAVAFCAIDFAGLARLFTPERGGDEPKEIWYLTGAWLLGATMNAVMTWWAVSMVLVDNPVGNTVLSHEQLLEVVPVFVAVLVWLTRILFIGAITIAGEKMLRGKTGRRESSTTRKISRKERIARMQRGATNGSVRRENKTNRVPIGNIFQEQPTRVSQRPSVPISARPPAQNTGSIQASIRRSR